MKTVTILAVASLMGLVCLPSGGGPAMADDDAEAMFADPMLRRCVFWLLTGTRGALIEPLCSDEYQVPPPSLLMCARKVMTGFQSQTDLEVCAVIFEEQAKRARSGYVKRALPPQM